MRYDFRLWNKNNFLYNYSKCWINYKIFKKFCSYLIWFLISIQLMISMLYQWLYNCVYFYKIQKKNTNKNKESQEMKFNNKWDNINNRNFLFIIFNGILIYLWKLDSIIFENKTKHKILFESYLHI